jgi:methylated-DNA-[protein]-cysteine S-methyltransferase
MNRGNLKKRQKSNPFFQKVYQLAKKIPKGKVTSYKQIAKALNTKAYRLVGQALKNNPYAPQVPCHRVIKSNGTIGGFKGKTAGRQINKKIKMLNKEGIEFKNKKIKDFKKKLFKLAN